MAKRKTKIRINLFYKAGILLVLSCLIHFLYDWFGFSWLKLFAPISESIFQHTRIFFSAYLIYSLVEYNFLYKTSNYWTSRLLISAFIPWMMAVIYLLPQSFVGKMPSEILEVVYAIVSTLAVWLIVVYLEEDLERVKFSPKTKFVIALFFVLLALSNLVFTFNLPVYDIFAEPVVGY